MQRRQNARPSLYLFDTNHQDFVAGKESSFPSAVTRKIAVRQYVYLMFILALPMIIMITVLVAIAGYQIEFLLVVEVLTALITCAIFVMRRYFRDRILRYEGKIIYGEIVRQEVLPNYSRIGTSTSTRIFYRFINPNNERVIDFVDLAHVTHRMADGRKYPEASTPVAILYANDKNHTLL